MKNPLKTRESDRRILDPDQFGLLGQILNVVADRYGTTMSGASQVVNNDPNTIIVAPVSTSEAGSAYIQRTLKTGRKLNAVNQYEPSVITLAIESTLTTRVGPLSNVFSTNLQGVLRYGTGMANQGTQSGAPLPFASIDLDPRIIFDLSEGTLLSFPTAYFELDLLLTSVAPDQGGGVGTFTAGEILSPNYQVVYSLGYEQQGHAGSVSMTQLSRNGDLTAGAGEFFFRPKYATSVYFLWADWTKTPLEVIFYNAEGKQVWVFSLYSGVNLAGDMIDPLVLPWPADAVAVSATNKSGADMAFFKCVSVLEF